MSPYLGVTNVLAHPVCKLSCVQDVEQLKLHQVQLSQRLAGFETRVSATATLGRNYVYYLYIYFFMTRLINICNYYFIGIYFCQWFLSRPLKWLLSSFQVVFSYNYVTIGQYSYSLTYLIYSKHLQCLYHKIIYVEWCIICQTSARRLIGNYWMPSSVIPVTSLSQAGLEVKHYAILHCVSKKFPPLNSL